MGGGGAYSSIAVNINDLYISYYDDYDEELKFVKSTNGGSTWATMIVDNDCWGDTSITVDGDNVYVSYHANGKLKFAKSGDKGETW